MQHDYTLGQFLAMRSGTSAKFVDRANLWSEVLADNGNKVEVTA